MIYFIIYLVGLPISLYVFCKYDKYGSNKDHINMAIFWPIFIALLCWSYFEDSCIYNKDNWLNKLIDKWKQ